MRPSHLYKASGGLQLTGTHSLPACLHEIVKLQTVLLYLLHVPIENTLPYHSVAMQGPVLVNLMVSIAIDLVRETISYYVIHFRMPKAHKCLLTAVYSAVSGSLGERQ